MIGKIIGGMVALLLFMLGLALILLGVINFGVSIEGKMVNCYDKEGNVIINQTCWDDGVNKQQAIANSIIIIVLGFVIVFVVSFSTINVVLEKTE